MDIYREMLTPPMHLRDVRRPLGVKQINDKNKLECINRLPVNAGGGVASWQSWTALSGRWGGRTA